MTYFSSMPRVDLGLYPTPLYRLNAISTKYGRNIYIKRDDLCGVALGGNKVRKLEFLLAQAKAEGCDTVFTTGGAQSNHAMLTAACAARLGMKAILMLKKRGVTGHRGNLVLNEIYGAEVRLIDTDSYDDIYAEMERESVRLAAEGHRAYAIPCGGSNAMGTLGYANCVREIQEQAAALGITPAQRPERVPYLRVLAANERGRALLSQMKKTAALPVITKPAQGRQLPEDAAQIFALEARATDLYTLAYPHLRMAAAGSEWTESPVIL